ncbi:MAG: aminoacetone oxidase family FAD-binding enzyme [Chloroflexi bacterium]|mgnify:FL=1|nr:aminoacetone oxidase family FAD-binding enzyme [Chloroflexota bacterium]|tara:strand:- start:127783 stop:129003 length:1221 start_codon:yes stop_codon:yes gene_type:complete
MSNKQYDVVVLGAGAAGLMCAITAAQRSKSVLVLEKSNKVGKKILMSGGGRCNFTNLFVEAEHFISKNPHFCKSALKRFTPQDFISMVEKHKIAYEEKKHSQLFCINSSKDILNMLLAECNDLGVQILTDIDVESVKKLEAADQGMRYQIVTQSKLNQSIISCISLVVATGALSIPTLGGSGFGYELAKQFKLPLVPRHASLVPFMFTESIKNICEQLSGVSTYVMISCNKKSFEESMLFTHRGISGPVVLQISNYWHPGDEIYINLMPNINAQDILLTEKDKHNKITLQKYLNSHLPKALVLQLQELWWPIHKDKPLSEISNAELRSIGNRLNSWSLKPSSTEGYRTAEVTWGGVDTNAIDSKTMEARSHPGLYFIGEVVDVTGHLGGYNFQWAWSSGYSAGLVA